MAIFKKIKSLFLCNPDYLLTQGFIVFAVYGENSHRFLPEAFINLPCPDIGFKISFCGVGLMRIYKAPTAAYYFLNIKDGIAGNLFQNVPALFINIFSL